MKNRKRTGMAPVAEIHGDFISDLQGEYQTKVGFGGQNLAQHHLAGVDGRAVSCAFTRSVGAPIRVAERQLPPVFYPLHLSVRGSHLRDT